MQETVFPPAMVYSQRGVFGDFLLCRDECTTNTRLKVYPSKAVLQVANDRIFPAFDYDCADYEVHKRDYDVPPPGHAADHDRAMEESRRRAKSKVRDIALCNSFTHMFTWTLDDNLIDRYDPEIIYKKLKVWLSNVSRRKGFKYVLIPEYHKKRDGEERAAIHMHGLCSLGDLKLVRAVSPAGNEIFSKSGCPVFNMPDFKYGFSTCVPLDENYDKAVSYVSKYITKSEDKIFGKWYLSSRDLVKSPEIVPIEPISFDGFVDDVKLANGEQFLCPIYRDVKVCMEEYEV